MKTTVPKPSEEFASTHWSVVLNVVRNDSDLALGLEALNQLCQTYWRPLYVYLRRRGYSSQDAEDLTQQFLADLLRRNGLSTVDPTKGKFRSFLIASLKNFLNRERTRATAQKRGGGVLSISLDDSQLEEHCLLKSDLNRTPEEAYEYQWALTVLEQVRSRLAGEYTALGKRTWFRYLAEFLPGNEPERSQQEIADLLGATASAVKSEVYRLRQRFGQYLRVEIAGTVESGEDIDREIEYLIQVVSRGS